MNSLSSAQKFLDRIDGKNINFLIGAGASSDYLNSLKVGSKKESIEDIYTKTHSDFIKSLINFYFFDVSVKKGFVQYENKSNTAIDEKNKLDTVFYGYKTFVLNIIQLLNNSGFEKPKRANIFTTNYDTFFETVFDEIAIHKPLVVFNDGSQGFFKREVSYKNYYFNVVHSGTDDYFRREIPSINLYKLHGSLTWKYDNEKRLILSSFSEESIKELSGISNSITSILNHDFKEKMEKTDNVLQYLENIKQTENLVEKLSDFNDKYADLLIVSPTKKKFEQTVFENQYYQLLRAFTNEMEKDNTVLIVMGFSFKDEHIRDIIRRSQYNPTLQIFIVPFSEEDKIYMDEAMGSFNNITFLCKYNNSSKTDMKDGKMDILNEFLSGNDNE
ncbi:SIR2 family protein [Companilactobacillus muriivasis]|uniref:SIR2 family protein n=1 Tax=Companilactobacillus muriivasis TaxID=3081444 RepID=UPI0030C73077